MSARYRRFGPRVTISLAGPDYDRLNSLAAKSEVSVSWVIRRAIDEFLRKQPPSRERWHHESRSSALSSRDAHI
jgi:predicted transcriptional regulator